MLIVNISCPRSQVLDGEIVDEVIISRLPGAPLRDQSTWLYRLDFCVEKGFRRGRGTKEKYSLHPLKLLRFYFECFLDAPLETARSRSVLHIRFSFKHKLTMK